MELTYKKAYDFMNGMYTDDLARDQTGTMVQARTQLELLCMKAIDKQIQKKPIHVHQVYPKHDWMLDSNGTIDMAAFEAGYCNGPMCRRCYHSVCVHCNSDWDNDECVIDEDHCPSCNKKITKNNKFCPDCGQALDWSQ